MSFETVENVLHIKADSVMTLAMAAVLLLDRLHRLSPRSAAPLRALEHISCDGSSTLRLLREGWIQVLGTDCHNMTSRAPRMDEAVRRIARALGEDAVQRLEMQAAALLPAREADP